MLSRNLFEASVKKLFNFEKFKDLPIYLRFIIFIFRYKGPFESRDLFKPKYVPLPHHFTRSQKMSIIEPFVGLFFIVLATVIALFFR